MKLLGPFGCECTIIEPVNTSPATAAEEHDDVPLHMDTSST